MDLFSKKDAKTLLSSYQIKPNKGLGQNFLICKAVLKKIIETAELKRNDVVLEVGPGMGVLTKELAKSAEKIIAVEKDQKMCEILRKVLGGFNNVEIISADILKVGHWPLVIGHYKVLANLPYYITSPVIRKFLEAEHQPESMVLMVQKEVGQRICAKPPKMNLLAVSIQFYAKPKIISYVKKECFWPKPKVDGAILKISAFNQYKNSAFCQQFFKIVKAGFSQPRKQLANNLSKGLKLDKERVLPWLLKNNIQPSQRAETLTIAKWVDLTKTSKL